MSCRQWDLPKGLGGSQYAEERVQITKEGAGAYQYYLATDPAELAVGDMPSTPTPPHDRSHPFVVLVLNHVVVLAEGSVLKV
jgi:hypothetical protein